jgi:hypothetical protein
MGFLTKTLGFILTRVVHSICSISNNNTPQHRKSHALHEVSVNDLKCEFGVQSVCEG